MLNKNQCKYHLIFKLNINCFLFHIEKFIEILIIVIWKLSVEEYIKLSFRYQWNIKGLKSIWQSSWIHKGCIKIWGSKNNFKAKYFFGVVCEKFCGRALQVKPYHHTRTCKLSPKESVATKGRKLWILDVFSKFFYQNDLWVSIVVY